MGLLEIKELTHGYGDKVLYQNAAFELFKGEHIGVVGQNGAGKSTLIQIIIGEVVADQGQIKWQKNCRIGYLDQYAKLDGALGIMDYLRTAFQPLYRLEEEMNRLYQVGAETGAEQPLIRAAGYQERLLAADFYGLDSRIQKVAYGLGLDAVGLERPLGELSGGQRAKVILAKLLLDTPDVLLLDEPTNFLDKEHVEWLAEYLSGFEGAYVVVSHDFDFLEKITTGICDIEFGTIKKYHGRYSEFVKQKAHLREDYIRQYHAQRREIERTEEYIRRNKAGVNSRMARGRQKQLDRLERLAPPSFADRPDIRFQQLPLSAQEALRVTDLEVGYYFPLIPGLSFTVAAGQKLVITGFNGIGKSTLLKTLVGAIAPLGGAFRFSEQVKIGYYEQDLKWEDSGRTPMQVIGDAYPAMTEKEIRRALAQCGVKRDHAMQAIGTLSGGEQSKVKLCRLLLTPCNFLILDEPTNHFDAETKAVLHTALRDFEGSIILVSHEEKFYKTLADKILDVETCFE